MESGAQEAFSGGVKLPMLEDLGEHLMPGRRTYMLNPYGLTRTLKLPDLCESQSISSEGESTEDEEDSIQTPIKLTKHGKSNKEAISSTLKNKKAHKISVEIDKKLSSVQKSFNKFEKNYVSVKGSMHDAVLRSASDSAKNKAKMISRPVSGAADIYQKYFGPSSTKSESIASDGTLTPDSPKPRRFSHLDSMFTVPDGCGEESGESCGENSFYGLSPLLFHASEEMFQHGQVYEVDKSPPSLGPIMENLSDKAFLTKLKIKDGKESRHMQKMRNRAGAIQQQLAIEKRKVNSGVNSGRPLYKPRKEHQQLSTKDSSQELMGFLQQNGGRTGSWNRADHAKFLRIYNTWKGVPELIFEKTSQEIKHKSNQEIMAHLKWFEEYEYMIESNKNQVRKWDAKKRQERAVIYQMTNEEQRTKLEDEKRRLEHLKSIRLEEKERARNKASSWRKESISKANILPLEIENLDADELSRQMLNLADKIQSMSHPFPTSGRKVKPPKLRNISAKLPSTLVALDSSSSLKKRPGITKSAPVSKLHVKLPLLEDKNQYEIGGEKNIIGNESGDFFQKPLVDPLTIKRAETVSRLTRDTLSHKLRKEAQVLKRMEIQSLEGRRDLHRQTLLHSIHSLQYKKATPSWKKIC